MNWKTLQLADPWILLLAPVYGAIIFLLIRLFARRKSFIASPWTALIATTGYSWRHLLRKFAFFAATLGGVLWFIALARPQFHSPTAPPPNIGVDMMIVLDTSLSMRIEDFQPNRLDFALEQLDAFIRKRPLDRIGLTVFGGEAFTLCPPTVDHDVLRQAVKRVILDITKAEGTAIGTALATAVSRLRDSRAKSRVIILVTDGVNNQGPIDPMTAAKLAEGFGIRVYTIGMGREGVVPDPVIVQDVFGRKVKRYQQVSSTVDFPLLTEIAATTGGRAFRAEDEGTLVDVLSEIDRLERSELTALKTTRASEAFERPLALGLFLIALSALALGTTLRVFP